ncbi:hypothetical protein HPB50_025197 [Hyalomma asiaticum]|uniref:Uncharacterized protein n=1 Tax=Hyalomma asiaticum TaxID=266040 RepID=A0ACB7S3B5_HYAAI|nr:hypothetical protein HPB50_025197 [Hyalomma asiaticum]
MNSAADPAAEFRAVTTAGLENLAVVKKSGQASQNPAAAAQKPGAAMQKPTSQLPQRPALRQPNRIAAPKARLKWSTS